MYTVDNKNSNGIFKIIVSITYMLLIYLARAKYQNGDFLLSLYS